MIRRRCRCVSLVNHSIILSLNAGKGTQFGPSCDSSSGRQTVRRKTTLVKCGEPCNIVQSFTNRATPAPTDTMAEQESSLGTRILRFFVKEDESAPAVGGVPPVTGTTQPRPAATSPATGSSANTSPSATTTTSANATASTASTPGNVDPKFAEHLATVLAQNNPPGPDYFEFRETLKSLTSLGLSEEKQFQAAWASFKALGGPTDAGVLTRTANQYVAALQKDRDGFAKSVDAALAERVGGLENEQKRLQAENDALTRQLQEIEQKRAANTERLSAITGEMSEQSAKIRQNQQNYETTYAHFVDQINDDVRKLTQYLQL